jgi:hypothetical protein
MITTVIGVYTLYIIIRLYVSVMQIGYINQMKRKCGDIWLQKARDDRRLLVDFSYGWRNDGMVRLCFSLIH